MKSQAYPLILILGIAFALRMLWVYQFHPSPRGEFLDVHIEASFNSIGRSTPRNYGSPGYPFLVSLFYRLFGPNYRIIHFLNACLGVLSCFLIYQLGQKIFIRRVGIIAGFLGAIHPGFVGLCTLLAFENLFIPLVLAGMLFLIEKKNQKTVIAFVPAGIFWASATLVRPTIMLFPFYLLAIYFRKYRHNKVYRKILVISLVTILFVAGWTVRNYQTVKYAKLIRQAGISLWLGNNPTSYIGIGTRPRDLSTSVFLDWRDRRYLKKALCQIFNHPLQFLGKMAIKVENLFIDRSGYFSFVVAENYYDLLSQKHYYNQAFYLDPFFRWFGYLLIAGLVVFSIESHTWEQPVGLLFHFILYWILIHTVFFAKPRFRLSIDPFLIIITAVTLLRLWNHISRKHYWSPAI